MLRLTVSITSTKASFLRYLTSLRRHEMAPVAWIVILDASSRCGRARQGQGRAHERGDREEGRERGTHDRLLRLDALLRDVHLECVRLRVLRVAKVEDLCVRGGPSVSVRLERSGSRVERGAPSRSS